MYPDGYPPSQQQPQPQVGHSRHHGPPPPLPPRNIPVQPTFPTDYTSVPRFVPYEPVTEYVDDQVNNHNRPLFPQAHPHVHARPLDPGQIQPYRRDDFTTPGHRDDPEPPPYSPPRQLLTPRGGLPYGRPLSGGFRPPPPPQMYVSQAARLKHFAERGRQSYRTRRALLNMYSSFPRSSPDNFADLF